MSAYEIIYREIAITVDLRSQSCLKVRPERRKKEVKRKLNRELTTIVYSPFFLTFSGRLCIRADDILVKPLKAQRGVCGRNLHLLPLRLYDRCLKASL
jgi:hypothetical protein